MSVDKKATVVPLIATSVNEKPDLLIFAVGVIDTNKQTPQKHRSNIHTYNKLIYNLCGQRYLSKEVLHT